MTENSPSPTVSPPWLPRWVRQTVRVLVGWLPQVDWLHGWAVLTVCATLGLLVLGSLVTTFGAGMADRDWPTHPLFLLREKIEAEAERQGYTTFLFTIEHSHRAAGWFVGACSIVLCAWLWLADDRTWMKWLGTAALVGVSLQGVLGGMRVRLHEWLGTDLATAHGCFAQLVFALLGCIALFTSPWWKQPLSTVPRRPGRLALGVVGIVYLQVIFGAIVRHSHLRFAQRLHFLIAFAVFGAVYALLVALREVSARDHRFRWLTRMLMGFLTMQILLGVEAWMLRFGSYTMPEQQPFTVGAAVVRTLHFVFGTLLFATTVLLAVMACRPAERKGATNPALHETVLEGVA